MTNYMHVYTCIYVSCLENCRCVFFFLLDLLRTFRFIYMYVVYFNTLASLRNLSNNSSTSDTMIPALRGGGSNISNIS